MPVSYSLTLISFLKTAILLFLQIRQGYDIFPLSGINEVIDFELINHCCAAHFFHDHSASASSEKDAHVSAADSIYWVKGAITNDGTCQTFSWKNCIIYYFDSQARGVITQVDDDAILIQTKRGEELLNLNFITRIMEYPSKK